MKSEWSFATAREPSRFGLAREKANLDKNHAYAGNGTLCGLPEPDIEVYLTLFVPAEAQACTECRQQAEAAPTQPCAQERLHDRISPTPASPLRDELLAALQQGGKVRMWVNGPATQMAKFYARLDHLIEGRPEVTAALDTTRTAGLARVEQGAWEYIIALPDGGLPVLGRATPDEGFGQR